MKCDDFDELICLFLDGRIDEGKKKELDKHLSTCKRCKEKLSLLESIEKHARGIKIKEPSQEYWDTFSSRVREKIVAQKEESFSFKLKNLFQNVLTFSPLRVKVAAGVISVVLVFIVGKLYVDYRGKEIVSTKPRIEDTKAPVLHAPEVVKETAPAEEKAKKKEKRAVPGDETDKSVSPEIVGEGRATPAVPSKQETEKKKESAPPEKESGQAKAARGIPKVETVAEKAQPKEEISLESQSIGAGAEDKGSVREETVPPEHEAKDTDQIRQKGMDQTVAESPSHLAFDRAVETAPITDSYTVADQSVPKIAEGDTFLQEDVLRKAIEVWNVYLEKNPTDSLANEGYLQVATAYYLLSRLTKDQSDLSKGIKLLEKYEKQATDPKIKEELGRKSKQLNALKER